MNLLRKSSGILITAGLLFLGFMQVSAQTEFRVPDPRPEIDGNLVRIYYDILNSNPEDRFFVRVEITDSRGNVVDARALEGELGNNIRGGTNKLVTWDLEKDGYYVNDQLFFAVDATLMNPPGPGSASAEPPVNEISFSRSGLVLQSLAFPGMGMTRLKQQPHWIRGAVGYGCITGSVLLNIQARKSYRDIEDLSEYEDKKELFEKSVRQDRISGVLAIASAGIWITDIIWTFSGTSPLKRGMPVAAGERLTLGYGFNPVHSTPTMHIVWRF